MERDDVSIGFLGREGKLASGYGTKNSSIGPGLGFGNIIRDAFDEPVLIITTAWGGNAENYHLIGKKNGRGNAVAMRKIASSFITSFPKRTAPLF